MVLSLMLFVVSIGVVLLSVVMLSGVLLGVVVSFVGWSAVSFCTFSLVGVPAEGVRSSRSPAPSSPGPATVSIPCWLVVVLKQAEAVAAVGVVVAGVSGSTSLHRARTGTGLLNVDGLCFWSKAHLDVLIVIAVLPSLKFYCISQCCVAHDR